MASKLLAGAVVLGAAQRTTAFIATPIQERPQTTSGGALRQHAGAATPDMSTSARQESSANSLLLGVGLGATTSVLANVITRQRRTVRTSRRAGGGD